MHGPSSDGWVDESDRSELDRELRTDPVPWEELAASDRSCAACRPLGLWAARKPRRLSANVTCTPSSPCSGPASHHSSAAAPLSRPIPRSRSSELRGPEDANGDLESPLVLTLESGVLRVGNRTAW